MSRGREPRHTVTVLACVALMAASAGCHSPFQRPADGRAADSSADGTYPVIPPLQPVPESVSVPERVVSRESMSTPVAPVPTPMLDAALKHAEAVEHVHREASAVAAPESSNNVPGPQETAGKEPATATKKAAKSDKEPVRSFKLPQDAQSSSPPDGGVKPVAAAQVPPVRAQVVDWLTSEAAKPANQALFQRAVNTIADAVKSSAKDDSTRSADIRSAVLALEDRAPLAVSNLRLCQKVSGFGSFEPLPDAPLKAGQSMILYWEVTGLRYQARDAGYVSRLASRLELVAARDGSKVWEQPLGEAEDQCRSRRRDNFVNYRITLPPTLPPGDYRLRLIQTDLVARRSASTELPLAVIH